MVQRGSCLGLSPEASEGGGVVLQRLGQKLECDFPLEISIVGEEDLSHASFTDRLENSVTHGPNPISWYCSSELPVLCRADSISTASTGGSAEIQRKLREDEPPRPEHEGRWFRREVNDVSLESPS